MTGQFQIRTNGLGFGDENHLGCCPGQNRGLDGDRPRLVDAFVTVFCAVLARETKSAISWLIGIIFTATYDCCTTLTWFRKTRLWP